MITTDSTVIVSKQTLVALRDTCESDAHERLSQLTRHMDVKDIEQALIVVAQLERSLAAAWAYDVLVQES